jgi:PAS domain S-box-containing protein
VNRIYRVAHFWIILTIMLCGALIFYADRIPWLQTILPRAPIELARYSTYRILSIVPVAYAAFAFGWRGGLITAVLIGLALLPRAIFMSAQVSEAITETVAFFFIGLLVTWLIHRQQRAVMQQQVITQQLRISEERYRGLFENSSDAIFISSMTATVISVNRACEELTGFTQKELVSTEIYDLFSGETRYKLLQMFSGKLGQFPAGGIEDARLTRKNGTEADVELRISPILRKDEVLGLQVIAQDVTEKKELRRNMEYYIQQVTKAQEDERLRISRELHDDTVQVLAMLSRGIDSLITGDKKIARPTLEQLKKLHEMADSALEGVRRFSQDLRPSILDDLGLVPALEWLITDLEKGYSISTKVGITGSRRRLAPEIELTVFRIAQEVFSNIRRHSQATMVEMNLGFSVDAMTLVIKDNGQGFNIPRRTSDLALSGKLGIIGMRERARLVGGTLTVQSQKGTGTTVTLRITA